MKKLLQEIRDFEKYKNCLSKELYEVYKNYLVERVLNEMKPEYLAKNFKRFFNKNEIDDSEATMEAINKLKRTTLNFKYARPFNRVEKSIHTNLENNNGEFCDKETFIQEFKKLNFDEFKDKADLGIKSTPDTFLNSFLEIYDDDGWLMLDDYEDVKKFF